MEIRPERPEEFGQIYHLIQKAFETAKVSDGTEQDFANGLRTGGAYLPELALVAEEDSQLIGHIMLTRLTWESGGLEQEGLLLAPLSVALEYRNRGVGGALIRDALDRAKQLGYHAVFLVGDPAYYSRFEFLQTVNFNIKNTNGIPDQFVQVHELIPGTLEGRGGTVSLQ